MIRRLAQEDTCGASSYVDRRRFGQNKLRAWLTSILEADWPTLTEMKYVGLLSNRLKPSHESSAF